MRDYKQTLDLLFNSFPMFQNIGAGAYKPGLENISSMLASMGDPHRSYPVLHVGGTNGKGSTAHTIAAVLQAAGYRTGLFTSPHLIDFRERIRIDGKMISEQEVVDFVERYGTDSNWKWNPSFFELTTAMAFEHFARHKVDVAVIEVGLGGRLDSTNVVTPCLSVITNISYDHVALLGDSLEKIAAEKAGIIKECTPVVIGECSDQYGVKEVFSRTALQMNSPVVYADEKPAFRKAETDESGIIYRGTCFGDIKSVLAGQCQRKNAATILCALKILCDNGWKISDDDVYRGFAGVCSLTGLAGRWMTARFKGVDIICDTGHNTGGWKYLSESLAAIDNLKMVIGFVTDKDVSGILDMMPRHANYYFVQASVRRALPASELAALASEYNLSGVVVPCVGDAVERVLADSSEGDTVFIGGSTFVVADFLSTVHHGRKLFKSGGVD